MTPSPQQHVADHPEAPTGAYPPVPAPGKPRRTFTARVTAAIGAGALVVGAGLGLLTGGLVGPGGPGGGPGGAPPGMSAGQDGTGTAPGGTAQDGTTQNGTATQGTATGT